MGKQVDNKLNWDRKFRRNISFRFNKVKDRELLEKYDRIPNKAEWFKNCIRKARV